MIATKLTIIKPDDFHVHLRDTPFLKTTVPDIASQFQRAMIMPNLTPPITNIDQAQQYYTNILQNVPKKNSFQPFMTLYLTANTSTDDIIAAKQSTIVIACKLYPAGATTHSQAGVKNVRQIIAVLAAMEENGLPLCIHGEDPNENVDIFDREKKFIDEQLQWLIEKFPKLPIVLEHISTEYAVKFILSTADHIAATITPHHLLLNRNHLLAGGIKPHLYCCPILKSQPDQQALITAATSGNKKFFLGSDSAPHSLTAKESYCGAAGIYSAPAAIALYLETFEQANALDKFEAFASHYGADFYGLPRNNISMILIRKPWTMPNSYPFGEETVVPLWAGQELHWQIDTTNVNS